MVEENDRPYNRTSNRNTLLKIVILGDGGVGKSCLMSRFISNHFDDHSFHTIGVEFMNKTIDVNGKPYTLQVTFQVTSYDLRQCLFCIRLCHCLFRLQPILGTNCGTQCMYHWRVFKTLFLFLIFSFKLLHTGNKTFFSDPKYRIYYLPTFTFPTLLVPTTVTMGLE